MALAVCSHGRAPSGTGSTFSGKRRGKEAVDRVLVCWMARETPGRRRMRWHPCRCIQTGLGADRRASESHLAGERQSLRLQQRASARFPSQAAASAVGGAPLGASLFPLRAQVSSIQMPFRIENRRSGISRPQKHRNSRSLSALGSQRQLRLAARRASPSLSASPPFATLPPP